MKSIPYYLRATLLALPAVLIGIQLSFWIYFATSTDRLLLCDFPHHYRIGRMVRDGHATEIYNTDYADIEPRLRVVAQRLRELDPDLSYKMPYLHPAYEALLFSSVSFLTMHTAYLLWLGVNVAAVVAMYRILLPYLPTLATMRPWIPFSLLLAFSYIPRAALYGQDSVILLLVLCGAFPFIVKGELFSAGVILGLGSFRFQHTLIIIILFLAWKAWKLAAGYVASGFACALASLAVTGLKGQIEYIHLLSRATHWPLRDEMDNLRGVFAWLGISDAYTPVLLLCFLALAAFLGRNMSRRNQFIFAIVALTLDSYYLFFFDLAVLFLPIVVLLEDALAESRTVLASFVLAVFAAPVWLLLVINVDQAQVMTAVVLTFFAVLWATASSQRVNAAALAT